MRKFVLSPAIRMHEGDGQGIQGVEFAEEFEIVAFGGDSYFRRSTRRVETIDAQLRRVALNRYG